MGFWSRLKRARLLRSTTGSLTAEAAIGMSALLFVAVTLLQSIGVVVAYLQLQVTGYEAFRILSASGDFDTRNAQAISFLESVDTKLEISIERDTNQLELRLAKPIASTLAFLPSQVEVSVQGLLLDAAVW